MSSIGLNEQHMRKFPSGMILSEIDASELFSSKEKMLVLEYKQLQKRLEENREQLLRLQDSKGVFVRIKIMRNNKEYWVINTRMKQIEDSKDLSSLLFRKRYELVRQQQIREQEIRKELEIEIIKRYLECK
ncbi:MAG: hypothetical protein IKJ59_10580 [Clostridia bacterium]|nr:hypothetical protein [Clostridia bacterium]